MSGPGELDKRLSLDFVNSVKDELRKIEEIEAARQILGEGGVELKHVSGQTPQSYWGNGVNQAIRRGVLKSVLERAVRFVGSSASDEAPDNENSLAKLLKDYDHEYINAVVFAATQDGRDLIGLLVNLEQHGDPENLRGIAIRIRKTASEVRQRLDDEKQFKALAIEQHKNDSTSADRHRERLAKRCYRIIVAADHVSRLSQILSFGSGEDEDDDDENEREGWGVVAVNPMLQMMREQHAQLELNETKLTLAWRIRGLLRDLRVVWPESHPET